MTSSNRINSKFMPSHKKKGLCNKYCLCLIDYLIFLFVLQNYNAIWSPELLFYSHIMFVPFKLLSETKCSSADIEWCYITPFRDFFNTPPQRPHHAAPPGPRRGMHTYMGTPLNTGEVEM